MFWMNLVRDAVEDGARGVGQAMAESAARQERRRARSARMEELRRLRQRVVDGENIDMRGEERRREDAGWEVAARQAAVNDFLLTYIAKLVPEHPVVADPDVLDSVADLGEANFVRRGRRSLDDARCFGRLGGHGVPDDWSRWGVVRQPQR